MSRPLTDRDALRADLLAVVDDIVERLAKPSDLYVAGEEELIEQYGDVTKVPIEASVKNANMEAGYNDVPNAIVDTLLVIRDIALQHTQPTGMQTSFADAQLLARSINFDGPLYVIRADRLLDPQYDGLASEWVASDGVRTWLAERAQQALLEEGKDRPEEVTARLEALAVSPKDVEVPL